MTMSECKKEGSLLHMTERLDALEAEVRERFYKAGDYSAVVLWSEDGRKYLAPLVEAGRMRWMDRPWAARFVSDDEGEENGQSEG